MTNPFSSYRFINATSIVKSNIRPNYVYIDYFILILKFIFLLLL
jgi:hypothetical protein